MNPSCFITQGKEYYYRFHSGRKKLAIFYPFSEYIRWNENEVITTIKNELKWVETPGGRSTWRGDCDISLLKLYLYKKTLGFNDKDDGLSCLIRNNQITRQKALERVRREGEIPENVIKSFFDKYGLNYTDLEIALARVT